MKKKLTSKSHCKTPKNPKTMMTVMKAATRTQAYPVAAVVDKLVQEDFDRYDPSWEE